MIKKLQWHPIRALKPNRLVASLQKLKEALQEVESDIEPRLQELQRLVREVRARE